MESKKVLEAGIRAADAALGSTHPQSVSLRDRLGMTLTELGEYDRAIALHDAALNDKRARFGPTHGETLA